MPGAVPQWGEWKFTYLEVVRIRASQRTNAENISGLEGAILGFSEEGYPASYAVAVCGEGGLNFSVREEDLESTGRHARYEDFYDGTRITVSDEGELLGWHEPPGAGTEG